MASFTLSCLLLGTNDIFLVRITSENFVHDMKKVIKAEMENTLGSVDAAQLRLWVLKSPVPIGDLGTLHDKLHLKLAKLADQLKNPALKVSEIPFGDAPVGSITVIIEDPRAIPLLQSKRKATEDIDTDNRKRATLTDENGDSDFVAVYKMRFQSRISFARNYFATQLKNLIPFTSPLTWMSSSDTPSSYIPDSETPPNPDATSAFGSGPRQSDGGVHRQKGPGRPRGSKNKLFIGNNVLELERTSRLRRRVTRSRAQEVYNAPPAVDTKNKAAAVSEAKVKAKHSHTKKSEAFRIVRQPSEVPVSPTAKPHEDAFKTEEIPGPGVHIPALTSNRHFWNQILDIIKSRQNQKVLRNDQLMFLQALFNISPEDTSTMKKLHRLYNVKKSGEKVALWIKHLSKIDWDGMFDNDRARCLLKALLDSMPTA